MLKKLIKTIFPWSPTVYRQAKQVMTMVHNQLDAPIMILLYHRCAVLETDPQLLAVTPENFANQVKWLKERYPVLRFDEPWELVREPSIVLTFDDGYWDNYAYAVPILERLHVPATIFVSTERIGTDKKLVLLLYDGDTPVYDEGNPRIANYWFLKKIKELVEVVDSDTVPFWGYVVKEHPEFCDFESADHFGRVVYPDRSQMLHHEINRYPSKAYLLFSEEEEEKGQEALSRMGLKEKQYFCFFSRSNEYHEAYFEDHGTEVASQTAVRNSSIEDFVQAIEQLNLPDIKAVRVGSLDSRKVSGNHIFDYTNMCRDEFLDFYIMGKAKFFFGDTSGIACIPWLMNLPQALTNNFSIFWCSADYYNYNSTMNFSIYKKWWHRKKNRYLTLREILDLSWKYGVTDEDELRLYRNLGIDFHDNTAEEIADFLYEMNLRVDGKWKADEEETVLRKKYWEAVNETMLKAPPELALWDYEPGGLFLKRNRWFLE